MAKVREYDRLVSLLARSLKYEGLSQKDAEKIVREHAESEAKRQRTIPLYVLRSDWVRLGKAKAHKNINEYIANGSLHQMDFEEFEETKSFFRRMYQSVRRRRRENRMKREAEKAEKAKRKALKDNRGGAHE